MRSHFVCLLLSFAKAFSQQPQVVITNVPLPIDQAKPISHLSLSAPPVYCVASSDAYKMKWFCQDCQSPQFNASVQDLTRDRSSDFGYPVIQLSQLPDIKSLHGKTLACAAAVLFNETDDSDIIVTASAKMVAYSQTTPRVLMANGDSPVRTSSGQLVFYVADGSVLALFCVANASQSAFQWRSNDTVIGISPTLPISDNNLNKVKCCIRNEVSPDFICSAEVVIAPFVDLRITANNFRSLETVDNAYYIGSTIILECQATGNPAPRINWHHQTFTSVKNISKCSPSFTQIIKNPQEPCNSQPCGVYAVASQCIFQVEDYEAEGLLFCSACTAVTSNSSNCTIQLPGEYFRLNVVGRPISRSSYAKRSGQNVVLAVDFCADPQPEVYWLIDERKLNIGREHQGQYITRALQPNGTAPDCYLAQLVIQTWSRENMDKSYVLVAQNRFGVQRMSIDVQYLVAEQDSSDLEREKGPVLRLVSFFRQLTHWLTRIIRMK